MDYEFGMLAWSRAGHDKDKLYVIIKTEGEYVYLSDGRLKPVERPKKEMETYSGQKNNTGRTVQFDRGNN